MKKIIFLSILVAAFFVSTPGMAAGTEAPGTASLFGQKAPDAESDEISPLLLAGRTEKKDSIIYGTDPDMERASDEQEREEKAKEEKSWKMLEHMYLYNNTGTQPTPPPVQNTPKQ